MLTKEELLLRGIKLPEEKEDDTLALPPSLNQKKSKKKEKKKVGLFSPALFKESLHANRLGLCIVSLGNALIMLVLIMILSTLNIGRTSSALKNMFANANTESQVKTAAIGYYNSTYNSAFMYETFEDNEEVLYSANKQAVSMITDTAIRNQIDLVKVTFDFTYRVTSGTEEEKNAAGKRVALQAASLAINSNTNYDEQTKEIAIKVISDYFDAYIEDKTLNTEQILRKTVPQTFVDVLSSMLTLDEDEKGELTILYEDFFTKVIDEGMDQNKAAKEVTFEILPYAADESSEDFILPLVDALKAEYRKDPDQFLYDKSIQQNIVKKGVVDFVIDLMGDIAFYTALPSFTVDVVTSDRGYPIQYVETGEISPSGNPIKEAQEIFTYSPDLFVYVEEGMGVSSNLAQKMKKEIITGQPYTQEEIDKAKRDAEPNIQILREQIDSFLTDFLARDENGVNKYYDGKEIIVSAIEDKMLDYVAEMAEQQIIDMYNEQNEANVSSIEEITAENFMMEGKSMIQLVKGYATSGLAAFRMNQKEALEKGYSAIDATLTALVLSSQGAINQLPDKVGNSLAEMGDMNVYGIMVGIIGFQIACLLIPMVYTILTATNLVAKKVETGSLAFTLSTPTTRNSFIFTEGLYMVFTEVIMGIFILAISLVSQVIGVAIGSEDLIASLPLHHIVAYSAGNFSLTFAISGICFLASCIFNKSDKSIACGGGVAIFFYICIILGLFGTEAIPSTIRIPAMNFFNYCSIYSFFDPLSVMLENWTVFGLKLIGLLLIGAVCYILGNVFFTKKDLPL